MVRGEIRKDINYSNAENVEINCRETNLPVVQHLGLQDTLLITLSQSISASISAAILLGHPFLEHPFRRFRHGNVL